MTAPASDTKMITGKVRLSYAHIWKPRASEEGQDPKYSVCLLIPKSDRDTLMKIKKCVDAARNLGVTNLWNGKLPPSLKLPLRDGDAERPDSPEYAGHYFLNCNSGQKPGIVSTQRDESGWIPIREESEVYSGCYARASINFFPFSTKGNKGVGAGLNNIQKLADGEPLSGRTRPEDDFDSLPDGDDDDFLN
jgi:hypothetical protein